ncbi:hypothetical protein AgCh_023456 [Apium graveolens]
MIIFLQHHLVAPLSPIQQKTALFQFKKSLTISAPADCIYYSYDDSEYSIHSHPKTMNWSMSSDYCIWDGVTCDHKTGDVIGLDLSCSGLEGAILPNSTLFQLSYLQFLNLSHNDFSISNQFPQEFGFFAKGLTHLNLSRTLFPGRVPSRISHLYKLASLDLGRNYNAKLEEEVFKSLLQNLTQLRVLNLYEVNISSVLPMNLSSSLEVINLGYTGLYGVPSRISHLHKLVSLDLSYNNDVKLEDEVFKSLLQNLTQLRVLNLEGVNISSVLPFNLSTSLRVLNLMNTGLHGVLPQEVFHLPNLEFLHLGDNRDLKGVLPKVKWGSSATLQYLSLYGINFNHGVRSTSMSPLPPTLSTLGLSSCNMKEFPHFSKDAEISLDYVDLSNNDIEGEIPDWIGSVSWYLDVSHNKLIGGLEQLPWNSIQYLDLQSNKLNGSLPELICNSSYLEGSLPANFTNFRSLETINLNGNKLEGRVPSSFLEFDSLRVLDLGNNQISDTFPQFLEVLPNLQVLVLKSNKFHGIIITIFKVERPFHSLRIIDLSYNEFSGPLPSIYFKNFKAMMNGDVDKTERKYMGDDTYYSDSMSLVIKGVETEFVRILTVFTTIDLSGNNFEGEIDEFIGNLVSLRYLNLSHNNLTGHIPSSTGKLLMLESLDLSYNRLEGEIPDQLSSLNTLARLNLSFNQLRGPIPVGPQLNTFENDSYVGNLGLCGRPLSKLCEHDFKTKKGDGCDNAAQEEEDDDYFFGGFTWEAVVIGYGCGVVPAFIIGYFMLVAGRPKWFADVYERLVQKGRKPGFFQLLATQTISALRHGLYPGYFIFFVQTALMIAGSRCSKQASIVHIMIRKLGIFLLGY